jgi:flagellin-specific chaperone FliS
MMIESNLRGMKSMKESKLLLSQFANEEGFELKDYLTQLFEYVSHQLVQAPTVNITTEMENS